jgi:hypothetical protein
MRGQIYFLTENFQICRSATNKGGVDQEKGEFHAKDLQGGHP